MDTGGGGWKILLGSVGVTGASVSGMVGMLGCWLGWVVGNLGCVVVGIVVLGLVDVLGMSVFGVVAFGVVLVLVLGVWGVFGGGTLLPLSAALFLAIAKPSSLALAISSLVNGFLGGGGWL